MTASRTACVWVPDWPLKAAEEACERAGEPVPEFLVLMDRHRVLAASSAAQCAGVERGSKKRAAQAVCPGAVLRERDRESEWAFFDAVAAAVDTVAAGVEILAPGLVLMHAHGPARHAGGEEQLAQALMEAVSNHTGWESAVGVADGPLAAILAAHSGRLVRAGESARFLAPFPIDALMHAPLGMSDRFALASRSAHESLSRAEVIDLLRRLGITTLGGFAALEATAVMERFGPDVSLLHLLARGEEPSAPPRTQLDQPILVERSLDPPLERVDQAAFVARPMADELAELLRSRAAACTRLRIVARSETGQEVERTWRHDGALSVSDVVDRVRWQCDGWIRAAALSARSPAERTTVTGPISHLQLIPVQLVDAVDSAPGLWGGVGDKQQRAARALTRVQSLGGENAVLVPAPGGGRLMRDLVHAVPFRSGHPAVPEAQGPWPGAPVRPFPATVFGVRPSVEVRDALGEPVRVTSRGLLSAPFASVTFMRPERHGEGIKDSAGRPAPAGSRDHDAPAHEPLPAALAHLPYDEPQAVNAFGAPQVLDQEWWATTSRTHRGARVQVTLEGGEALVLLSERGAWSVEAIYD